MSLPRNMNLNTGDSEEDGADEVELGQMLMDIQQLTKEQTSYTTALQSLNERQSAVNDRLLQIGAAVESGRMWKKLKNVNLLERENQSLRKKVDELTKSDATLKSKLSESTSNSKKLLQSKQQLQKYVDELRAKLDSSQSEQKQQQVELKEIKMEKRRLLQRVNELTVDVEKLQRETSELKEKLSGMERLQALRNLRELEDSCVNEEETTKMRLELIEETAEASGRNKHSGWRSV